jgi:putative DNA primase/helicase
MKRRIVISTSEYLDNFAADMADMDSLKERREFDPSERPIVSLDPGRLAWTVDAVEQVLLRDYKRWGLYQRADILCRVAIAELRDNEKVSRPKGAIILRPATPAMIQDICNRAIDFRKVKEGESLESSKPVNCPASIANTYMSRSGLWRLPYLTGVITAPVLRPDGSVLTKSGYDESTDLLLHSAVDWPALPPHSEATIGDAVRCLLSPFAEFPFVTEADRSVIISGILTGLQRRLLTSAPAHGMDATAQGSGKSLLADAISLIVTGRPAASVTYNRNDEEFRKKLFSVLLAGDPILSIDNVTSSISNDAFASILTLTEYKDRLLCTNQYAAVPTNALFLITGNNLNFSGDMPSRVIVSRINPNVERPEERTFTIENLRSHILEHRAELVTAALTILQGYFLAGRPSQNLKPFGRFEEWSDEIRSAIVWAGLTDPCLTREKIINSDPERDATIALYTAWHEALGEAAVTVADLIRTAKENNSALLDALLEIAADRNNSASVGSHRLARWMRGKLDRVVGEFVLSEKGVAHGGAKTYKLSQINGSNYGN